MLINSRPVMRTGPEVPTEASSLPVSPPATIGQLSSPYIYVDFINIQYWKGGWLRVV